MPSHSGFKVSVLVDDKPLDEYGTFVSPDGRTFTSYIVSQEGKRNMFRADLNAETRSLHGAEKYDSFFYVDGQLIAKYLLYAGAHQIIRGHSTGTKLYPYTLEV